MTDSETPPGDDAVKLRVMRCCCRCCCTWISNKRRTFSFASFPIKVKTIIARSNGTVPTSAKARLTSAAVRRISIHERMSVNHLPCLPIMTNPENYPCIQTVVQIATKIEPLVHRPIANLPWKFHANPFGRFCAKLLKANSITLSGRRQVRTSFEPASNLSATRYRNGIWP